MAGETYAINCHVAPLTTPRRRNAREQHFLGRRHVGDDEEAQQGFLSESEAPLRRTRGVPQASSKNGALQRTPKQHPRRFFRSPSSSPKLAQGTESRLEGTAPPRILRTETAPREMLGRGARSSQNENEGKRSGSEYVVMSIETAQREMGGRNGSDSSSHSCGLQAWPRCKIIRNEAGHSGSVSGREGARVDAKKETAAGVPEGPGALLRHSGVKEGAGVDALQEGAGRCAEGCRSESRYKIMRVATKTASGRQMAAPCGQQNQLQREQQQQRGTAPGREDMRRLEGHQGGRSEDEQGRSRRVSGPGFEEPQGHSQQSRTRRVHRCATGSWGSSSEAGAWGARDQELLTRPGTAAGSRGKDGGERPEGDVNVTVEKSKGQHTGHASGDVSSEDSSDGEVIALSASSSSSSDTDLGNSTGNVSKSSSSHHLTPAPCGSSEPQHKDAVDSPLATMCGAPPQPCTSQPSDSLTQPKDLPSTSKVLWPNKDQQAPLGRGVRWSPLRMLLRREYPQLGRSPISYSDAGSGLSPRGAPMGGSGSTLQSGWPLQKVQTWRGGAGKQEPDSRVWQKGAVNPEGIPQGFGPLPAGKRSGTGGAVAAPSSFTAGAPKAAPQDGVLKADAVPATCCSVHEEWNSASRPVTAPVVHAHTRAGSTQAAPMARLHAYGPHLEDTAQASHAGPDAEHLDYESLFLLAHCNRSQGRPGKILQYKPDLSRPALTVGAPEMPFGRPNQTVEKRRGTLWRHFFLLSISENSASSDSLKS